MHSFRSLSVIFVFTTVVTIASGCFAANALPPEVVTALKDAKSFDLYSIEPVGRKDAKETFHDYPVLGKTTVADAKTKDSLIDALQKGVAGNDGMVAACFNPRHAIRVVHEGKTYDLVICFECLQISVYVDNVRGKGVLTTGKPKAAFDKVLKDAKVPLAE